MPGRPWSAAALPALCESLPDHDLYIEHFALDEAGNAPPHFQENYEAGIRWKRDIHRQNGTRPIETYSWQFQDGVVRDHLRGELLKAGVKLRTASFGEVLRKLRGTTISSISDLLATFLQHVRGAGLSRNELRRRARASDAKVRNLAFLALFEPIRDTYEAALQEENTLDFSTVHRAKGLEADYGIVLDLSNRGFPSRKQDDPVLRMVLPAAKASLPHGEERRLFVAASRPASWPPPAAADEDVGAPSGLPRSQRDSAASTLGLGQPLLFGLR